MQVQENAPLSLAILRFYLLHAAPSLCKHIPRRLWRAYPLTAGKTRHKVMSLDISWTSSLVTYRILTEGKEVNEYLSSQSSLFLSNFHTSKITSLYEASSTVDHKVNEFLLIKF